MKRRKSDQPAWEILRILAVFAGAALILKVTAKSFDETEVTALIFGLLTMLGYKGAATLVGRKRKE